MPRSFPGTPNADYLRKEAKDLLRAHRAGDPATLETLRMLERFAHASDAEALDAELTLHEAQFALAMDYGFGSWPQLLVNVETMRTERPEDRDRRRIVIHRVPHGSFDMHWDMPVRAMETLLGFRGVTESREELLAVSGDAFSLCHASHFQGTAYLSIPTNPVKNLAEAYGFAYDSTHLGPTGYAKHTMDSEALHAATRQALSRIHAEIDSGRPVLISGAEAHCGSSSIVVGYELDRDWLCHVGDGEPYRWTPIRGVAPESVQASMGVMDGRCRGTVTPGFVGGWQANPAYLIGTRKRVPSPDERILGAARRAVELHTAPPASRRNWGGVDYFFGAEAYEAWAGELESLDYPDVLDGPFETNGVEDAYDWYEMGNMDMQVDQIVVGRTAAAAHCRQAAELLGGTAARALSRAASAYDTEVEIARQAFEAFIPRFDGDPGRRHEWLADPDRRRAGADAVRTMLEHERRAVAALAEVTR